MNILFIGYWALNDGLTQSTILPHLEILAEFTGVRKIMFASIERAGKITPKSFQNNKIEHRPLYSRNFPVNIINKFDDFIYFPNELAKICEQQDIGHIICRGAPAGSLGYLVFKKTGIPFSVESFEPHSDYMLESGVWKIWDLRYIMQKHWEKKQKKYSFMLFPASNNYRDQLINENIPVEKMFVQPCEVNLEEFNIDSSKGRKIRDIIKFSQNALTGIYVGKFGDIYFKEEAFNWFQKLKRHNSGFKLIILTGQDKKWISKELFQAGFSEGDFFIGLVNHDEVAGYLNAADFAFCLHRPHRISHAYSPVKNGEYWACGLPVMIPVGIGDDSRILKETGLGVVVEDIKHPGKYFSQLDALNKAGRKEEIRQLAVQNRNPDITRRAYEKLIAALNKNVK